VTPAAQDIGAAPLPSAPLRRRLASFVYEGVLLFGVLMISGYLFSSLTQQRHALIGRAPLQGFLFLVLGIYFVWFWSRGGQTVAMKAWHIRLVTREGKTVSQTRALARYILSWLWFVPALSVTWISETRSLFVIFSIISIGVLAYAVLAFTNSNREFLHDRLCGTRLVHAPPILKA
jgi:uncharacterized RDD family membrane protein YckC